MDLIAALTAALDTDAPKAESLAASSLASIEAAVRARSPEAARTLAEKVPELAGWSKSGARVDLGATPVQGLMGLSKILLDGGLDPAKAMGLGSIVVGFLQSRGVLDVVAGAVPSLGGLGGAAGGTLGQMFGGAFGGKSGSSQH